MSERQESQIEPVVNAPAKQQKANIDATNSSQKGIAGLLETLLRRFRLLVPIALLGLLYLLGSICMGIALTPALYFVSHVYKIACAWQPALFFPTIGIAIAIGYFLYGFSLILVIPLANFLLPWRIKPWRGIYYSLGTVPWFFHNALAYIVRYTFLKFITPTPYNVLYFRLMGMKIGKGVQINSVNISDPSLLVLEDKVTIGGSATIISHYGVGGFLIIAPVCIRKKATIGIKATIMGDVEIGEGAKVLANSVVMPKTKIPAGEIWAGVPAKCIKKAVEKADKMG